MSVAFVVLSFSLLLLARSDPDIHRHSPFNKKIHTQNKNKNKKSTAPHSATVADTKERFLQAYSSPIPAMYSPVVQELLVQQHLQRYNANYVYNPLYALGIMSVFDQILESLENKDAIVDAYFTALQEDLSDYRRDADAMEEWAKGLSSSDDIKADASGTMGQKVMAEISEKVAADKFLYTNFLAVGVFRVLELSNCTDPEALKRVVAELGLKQERVTSDLATYKGILSKLSAAKELMKEYLERENRKTAERLAKKSGSPTDGGDAPAAPTAEPATASAATAETSTESSA